MTLTVWQIRHVLLDDSNMAACGDVNAAPAAEVLKSR